MKIALILSSPDCGLLYYPVHLALALRRLHHDVIGLSWSNKEQSDGLIRRLYQHDIPIRYVPSLAKSTSLPVALRSVIRQASPSVERVQLLIGYGPLSLLQCRHVLEPGGRTLIVVSAMGRARGKTWKPYAGAFLLNQYADIVVALCHLEQNRLESLGIHRKKIRVIHNPVDVQQIRESASRALRCGREPFLRRLGLQPERRIVLCTANFYSLKRHDILVEAFDRLHNRFPAHDLALAGEGPEKNNIKEQVSKRDLHDRVSFVGRLPNDDVLGLLSCADIAVHCSSAETFGYSMVEPLLLRIPAVITKAGIGWEIAQADAATVVPIDDQEALSAALEDVLSGETDVQKQLYRGYDFVMEKLAIDHIAAQLLSTVNG